jgi:hypothetical protein
LLDLRKSLEGKLTTAASDVGNGGYMLKVNGAQLEVAPMPNWSINIYNSNTVQPDAESDNFKVIYSEVATALGLDVNQKPAALPNGKTSMQSTSKIGSVSIVRDPQTGNSVVITPNQQRKAMVQPPAQPAQPVAPPTQPKAQAPAQPAQPAPAAPAPATPAAQPKAAQPAAQPAPTTPPAQPNAQPAPATPPAQPKQ